jgi:hypothetical protein
MINSMEDQFILLDFVFLPVEGKSMCFAFPDAISKLGKGDTT